MIGRTLGSTSFLDVDPRVLPESHGFLVDFTMDVSVSGGPTRRQRGHTGVTLGETSPVER